MFDSDTDVRMVRIIIPVEAVFQDEWVLPVAVENAYLRFLKSMRQFKPSRQFLAGIVITHLRKRVTSDLPNPLGTIDLHVREHEPNLFSLRKNLLTVSRV